MIERKEKTRLIIEMGLINILESAKVGNKYTAKYELHRFTGIIFYAKQIGDIKSEVHWRLYNLSNLIRKKYDLY